jgi:L-ascorbate metabolism protein UlaG (beta-lactamase superfamily)
MPQLTYIGHATVLIEMDSIRVLTDPILRNWVWHLRRQKIRVDERWHQNIDAVLISHIHWDHLHLPSLKLLDKTTRLFVPQGMASSLLQHGFQYVKEMSIGETIVIGDVSIKATYARHHGARFRFGPSADCLGFIISGSYTIYFAGDTDLFPEMENLAESLDVALLPVWGWGPTLGTGHLDPYRAAKALQLLRPRLAIPIHWGTFFPFGLGWILPRLLTDPPYAFVRFAARLAADVKTQVVPPGSSISLEEELPS